MSNITTVSAKDFHGMIAGGVAYLTQNAEQVNNLNVFPVPDGDTGTNMLSTVRGACSVTVDDNTSVAEYAEKTANAMMRSSRGNSGVILSLFFRGVAKALAGHDTADKDLLLSALRVGAVSAASAVAKPVEGTILTVMRDCCKDEFDTNDISEFFGILISRADAVLQKTPEMLLALKRAKVVDSGGQGFVIILQGMKAYLDGNCTDIKTIENITPSEAVNVAGEYDSEINFAFCTECLVRKNEGEGEMHGELREWVGTMGDSMVFVEDESIIKLHVHTNEPLEVLGKMCEIGVFEKCKIENMRIQHSNLLTNPSEEPKKPASEPKPRSAFAIVAVCDGNGMSDALKEAGVTRTVSGGRSMNPSTEDILNAVKETNAETVFVLPNNKNTVLAATQAAAMAKEDNINIRVIPTHTVPEGISAAMAFNASRSADDNEKHMRSATKEVNVLSIARAVRPAETSELSVKKNQFIGIIEGNIRVAEDSVEEAVKKLISKIDECDCYTLYYGSGVKEKSAQELSAIISEAFPDAEVYTVFGGQKVYPIIISAE